MIVRQQRITIIHQTRPSHTTLNDELLWLGQSLGLFSERDKDKSCFRVFLEVLKASKRGVPVSSDEVASRLHLTRGTVVHHLHKLIELGLVISSHNKYMMRVDSLEALINDLIEDFERATRGLKRVAKDIDTLLDSV